MQLPEWLRPTLYGAAAGAGAAMFIGFSWGGWVTDSAAAKRAADTAKTEVVAALVPICIDQSTQDPQVAETMAMLEAARNYERAEMVMDAGWATVPGATAPDRSLASACAKELATQF